MDNEAKERTRPTSAASTTSHRPPTETNLAPESSSAVKAKCRKSTDNDATARVSPDSSAPISTGKRDSRLAYGSKERRLQVTKTPASRPSKSKSLAHLSPTMHPSPINPIEKARFRAGQPVQHDHTALGWKTYHDMPAFDPMDLVIYNWGEFTPADCTDLDAGQRLIKRKMDAIEKADDIDDGADDWHQFCGNAAMYDSVAQLFICIAKTFVIRAKRALWAGKSWSEFERKEIMIDSESVAKSFENPVKRKVALQEALENDLRMAVFYTLSPRLCSEVWAAPYPGPMLVSKGKRDSAVSNVGEGSNVV